MRDQGGNERGRARAPGRMAWALCVLTSCILADPFSARAAPWTKIEKDLRDGTGQRRLRITQEMISDKDPDVPLEAIDECTNRFQCLDVTPPDSSRLLWQHEQRVLCFLATTAAAVGDTESGAVLALTSYYLNTFHLEAWLLPPAGGVDGLKIIDSHEKLGLQQSGWGCKVEASSISVWLGSEFAPTWSKTVPLPGPATKPETAGPTESR